MKTKLAQKDFTHCEIEACIHFCLENGYLNDERYAYLVIKSHVNKGHGVNRIQQVLIQKGIDRSICQQVLLNTHHDWFELAKHKVFKKYGEHPIADFKDKAKRIRYLLGQGFSYEQANYALDEKTSTHVDD
nr:regulatory protein RecX [Shewanella surugensis]